MNSLNFCLSVKLLISPSILNEILARQSNLSCRFSPFSALNISCHPLLVCRVCVERSAVKPMGFPLLAAFPFLLLIFFVFSHCQFEQYVSWLVSPSVYPAWDSLHLLDLIDYFLFHVGEIFNSNLFKNFLLSFLFLFFFCDPCNSNVGAFNIAPEVSEAILSSFHSSYFTLLFSRYFHHFIFQLTDLFFCFRYSAINSFSGIFNFSNYVACLCISIL